MNELSLDEYARLFSKINVNWIDVSGGDIFLRDDIGGIFSLIIKSQKRLGLLHFPTNSFFIDKIYNAADYVLKNSNVKLIITISLDGPAGAHNYIRGIDNWHDSVRVYKALKAIKSKRLEVYFGYTISNLNFNKIEQAMEELKNEIPDIAYSDIHINIAHKSSHYYLNQSLDLDSKKIKEGVDHYLRNRKYKANLIDYLEHRYQTFIREYLNTSKTPLQCRGAVNSVFIDPEGIVFPCSIYDKSLGNLRENNYDLIHILKAKRSNDIRKQIRDKECPQCWTPCEAYQMILASLLKI